MKLRLPAVFEVKDVQSGEKILKSFNVYEIARHYASYRQLLKQISYLVPNQRKKHAIVQILFNYRGPIFIFYNERR
jgi:hypothetical protein